MPKIGEELSIYFKAWLLFSVERVAEMSHSITSDSTDWAPCAPGTLQSLSGQLRSARKRKAVQHVATPLILLALLGVGYWTSSQLKQRSEFYFGDISCREVQINLKLYSEGRLTEPLSKKLATHLRDCPRCQALLRAMNLQQPDEVDATPLYEHTILASMKFVR